MTQTLSKFRVHEYQAQNLLTVVQSSTTKVVLLPSPSLPSSPPLSLKEEAEGSFISKFGANNDVCPFTQWISTLHWVKASGMTLNSHLKLETAEK